MNADGDRWPFWPARSLKRDLLTVGAIALAYLVIASAALSLRVQPEDLPPIWPAAGIFLSALLLTPRTRLPWLVGALFLADLSARALVTGPLPVAVTSSLFEAGGAVLSVWLLQWFAIEPFTLTRVRHLAAWLLLSVVLSGGLTSLATAATSAWLTGNPLYWDARLSSFASRFVGSLLVTPLILTWAIRDDARSSARSWLRMLEPVFLCALTVLLTISIISQFAGHWLVGLLLPGGCFPLLLWAAFRFGGRGVATVLTVIAATAVAIAAAGGVPNFSFSRDVSDPSLFIQLVLVILAVPALFLTTALAERTRTETTLARSNRALRMISECKEVLGRATTEAELLHGVCQVAVNVGGYRLAWIGFAEQDEGKTVRPVAQFGFEEGYLNTLGITWADSERGRGPMGRTIRHGRPTVTRRLDTDPAFRPWRAEAVKRGYASAVGLPLNAGGQVLGGLMLYSARPDAVDAEELTLLSGLGRDLALGLVTVRARHEHELARHAVETSEVRYRRLFEAARDGILILDAETGVIVDVNPFLTETLGYTRDEILGKRLWDLGFLADVVANHANFLELREHEFIRYEDMALETRDGRRIEVEFVSNVYMAGDARVIQCNIRDIGDRKRAEAEVRASERLTDAVINALPARVFWKDANLAYLGCNAAFARDAGLADPRDIIGKRDDQMAWRDQAAAYNQDDRDVMANNRPKLFFEEEQTTPAGHTITLLTSKAPLHDANGDVYGVVGTYLDITPLKQAEASAQRLALAVRESAEAIMVTDAKGAILDVNPAFEKSTGYARDEVVGQNPRMLKSGKHDTAFYQGMWAVLHTGQTWRGRLTNRRKDGTLYDEDVSISPMRDVTGRTVSFVAVKRDVTRQQQLEAQLRRAQRLESIGTLAGGIAHDLNNALAPILMASELLRLDMPDRAADDISLIQDGARRGADLVKHLLTFARGAEGERRVVDVRTVCDELERIVRSTFPKTIELHIGCPKNLPAILGDATQLHQVLLNLLVNARDAMPDGGTLSLIASSTEVSASDELQALSVQPGRFVALRVTDTGTGISPEVQERIFDPFFTTKGPEMGTGLGLSTSLGIVRGHGGFIRVYSVPGKGTTFTVYLPTLAADARDESAHTPLEIPFRGHGETILVVDDEAAVREILRKVLTRMNFTVVTAADGTGALREVTERGTQLAAVITDLHMPQLDGLSFARVLHSRLPRTGVIVVSGLVGEAERHEFGKLGVRAVLQKPFTQAELVAALQAVFES
jgi:PAS domain S-box-containing protein